MIKQIIEGNCIAVKEDKYKVMVDDVNNLCIQLKDTYRDKALTVVLNEQDAMLLAERIIECYERRGEFANV